MATDWITVSPLSGSGNSVVTVTPEANPLSTSRSLDIKVSVSGIEKTVRVVQAGTTPYVRFAESTLQFGSSGGTRAAHIESNRSWSIQTDDSWYSVSPSSGYGDTVVTVTADGNGFLSREANLSASTVSETGLSATLEVTQPAITRPITIEPESILFESSGGTVTLNVSGDLSWSISGLSDWFTITPSSGTGDTIVTVSATSNSTPFVRNTTLFVEYPDGGFYIPIAQNGEVPIVSTLFYRGPDMLKTGSTYNILMMGGFVPTASTHTYDYNTKIGQVGFTSDLIQCGRKEYNSYLGCINNSTVTDISLPTTVVRIGCDLDNNEFSSFAFNKYLFHFYIHEGVTEIGDKSFIRDYDIDEPILYPFSVNIPSTVRFISGNPFHNSYPLFITVSKYNPYFSDLDGSNCVVRLSDRCLLVGPNSGVVPYGVEIVGDPNHSVNHYGEGSVFAQCITNVTIPNTVKELGGLGYMLHLTGITIPNSVRKIASYCFYLTALQSIILPSSVTYIGGYAFSSSWALSSITIPNSVNYIGTHVFEQCDSLTSITYNGIMAQWDYITKESNWNYGSSISVIHCSDGDINL